ncbi:hypothetical protein [Mycolicibacterium fortuitum]|uniref:hypothetical protein n=1 Tax=Mycolicibacterium fortuitum TaxID=1766 RepID=UPI001CE20228|nr:hypothetical protein [Mycolicibacterium fortuitum]MCA4726890.1 hypothetical protein [Mycolicibacterium fortuitum]
MTASLTAVDPASRSASSWSATLASLKSRGGPDTDVRVIAARQGLAYWRCRRTLDAEAEQLSRPGVDRLVSQLRQAVAR